MPKSRKYRAFRDKLGTHQDVPVYANGLKISAKSNYYTNEKKRKPIQREEAGIPKDRRGRKHKVVDAGEAGPAKKGRVGTERGGRS